ncbi:chromodomain helicase hrp1, putative [Entamoeba invadens IP1]|uniref:Chromodomain helicase hrp1, putative n=1 Tax=Entamoeba invadens IP1 TaxID=370355 RepID=A0A0A1U3Z7_ENTIV|nr:chromodomain helicase hrp1, putative [Entamoeba invadens IP1]ELP87418.1 chromodomain helicase hrp1, putative [Entamoeba invadens IP1]|eukprot:XP_004254189.1 chromodomain helicase hrp1, putative [Entamoeba invadens IP1]
MKPDNLPSLSNSQLLSKAPKLSLPPLSTPLNLAPISLHSLDATPSQLLKQKSSESQALPSFFGNSERAKAVPVAKPKTKRKNAVLEEMEEEPTEMHYELRKRSRQPSALIDEDDDIDETLEKKKKEKTYENGIPDSIGQPKILDKIIGIKEENSQRFVLVKWRGMSYLHVDTLPENVFLTMDGNVNANKQKIKRFLQKKKEEEEEMIPQEYTTIDRVISMSKDKTRCLVKWQKLGYNEATWENTEEITENDGSKIEEYYRYNNYQFVQPLKERVWNKKIESPVYKNNNTLRSYQLEGHNWMVYNWCKGRGCILADEMGLGKTVQVVTFLEHLHSYQKLHGPFLIVMPLGMVEHWHREISEWTDLNVILYSGSKENRKLVKKYEWFYTDEEGNKNTNQTKFNVMVTTYETLIADFEDLQQISWFVVVIDEAQRLKNKDSKLLKTLSSLKTDHKILLTGTPIQNNLGELWTLLNYIEPKKFGSLEEFDKMYGNIDNNPEQVTELQKSIKPFLLRRVKSDVEKSIPPKEETVIEVELTMVQKQYYRALYEKNREFLNKGCVGSNMPNLQNLMMQLRKVCNHPYLISGVEEKDTAQFAENSEEYFKQLIKSSGKLVLLDKLLPKLYEDKHKVLIFSQLKKVLNIIEKYLKYKGYLYERLDGSIRALDRQNAIDRFMNPEMNKFVFLLCTRAGGFGINLSEADTVIIYDSDWNPQNDLQAQARCHRIGQKKEVKVYRLVSKNTYERYMFERASKKLGLDQAVLANVTSSNDSKEKTQLSKAEIESLLKYGAYGVFKDDEESSSKFCEEDIEQILEKRSSKVVWKGDSVTGGSFSTATFQVEADAVDVNDKNFWEKVLPRNMSVSELSKEFSDIFEGRGGRSAEKKRKVWMEEKKDEFMKEIFGHIDTIVGEYESKGKISSERDALNALIEDILKYSESFETSEVERLKGGLEGLKFTRYRRSTVNRISSATIGDELTKDEEIVLEIGKKKRKKEVKEEMSEENKRMWYDAVIDYGRINWTILRDRARVGEEVNQEYLHVISVRFLQNCIGSCSEQNLEKKYFVKLLVCFYELKGKRESEVSEIEEYPLEDEFRWIASNVKSWGNKLKFINRLSTLFENSADVVKALIEIPNENCNFNQLTKWWNNDCDKDLVIGIYKYGFSCGEYLQQDKKLCFAEMMQQDEEDDHGKDDESEDEDGINFVVKLPKEFPNAKDLDRQGRSIIAWLDKYLKKMKRADDDD